MLLTAKKQKALPSEVLTDIENKIYADTLTSAEDIGVAWKQLSNQQKKVANNIAIYSKALIEKGDSSSAEKIISSALKNNWSDELAVSYTHLTLPTTPYV